jgi:tol-pal system protein YbgF
MIRRGLALALLALAAGAAQAALFDDDEARKQISNLRNESRAQAADFRAQAADIRAQIAADQKATDNRVARLEDGFARIEGVLRDRVLDLAQLIDELKRDLAGLRGQVEILVNQGETLERRQKDLYVDLDARMRKLEQAQNQIGERAAQSERDVQAEKQNYETALNQFKVGNYQASIAAFQTFIVNYPNNQLVPSAQYWVGNAYYALRDYKVAISAQEKVLKSWPDNAKAPDAMLNIASAQAELGDQKSARETLRMLMQRYPSSPAAEQAKLRLQKR